MKRKDIYDAFKLRKTLCTFLFLYKYFSAVRGKNRDLHHAESTTVHFLIIIIPLFNKVISHVFADATWLDNRPGKVIGRHGNDFCRHGYRAGSPFTLRHFRRQFCDVTSVVDGRGERRTPGLPGLHQAFTQTHVYGQERQGHAQQTARSVKSSHNKYRQSARFHNLRWPLFCQIWIIFIHSNLYSVIYTICFKTYMLIFHSNCLLYVISAWV